MLHAELEVVQATLPQPRASEVLVDSLDVQVAAHGVHAHASARAHACIAPAYAHAHAHAHAHGVCDAARHDVAYRTAFERAPMAGGGAAETTGPVPNDGSINCWLAL